jgi:lysophospholipase L1-like esterase
VTGSTSSFEPEPDWHPEGRAVAYKCEDGSGICRIAIGSSGGPEIGSGASPSWSHSGSRLAFDDGGDVWTMDADGDHRNNLTDGQGSNDDPDWSPRPAPLPKLYVALGDSLAKFTLSQQYPERFFSFLDQAGAADILQNLGLPGETSAGLNQSGHGLPAARQLIDDPNTDATVVTVDIGANDILNAQACDPRTGSFDLAGCQPTLDQFETNFTFTLQSLAASIAGDLGSEQVIAMAYFNPWSGRAGEEATADRAELVLLGSDRTLDCTGSGQELGLNDRVACIAAENHAKLADTYPPFLGHGDDWFADFIHPNDTGYQVIADTFVDVFETP